MDIRSFFGGQKPAPPLADEEKNPTVNQKQKNVPKDELLDSDDDKIDDKLKSIRYV